MADVFISYAQQDRPRVTAIRDALADLGVSTWFDIDLSAGDNYPAQINSQIRDAKAMLVCWSAYSVERHWVTDEANFGLMRQILIPLRIEQCTPMPPFFNLHTEDLSDWDGSSDHDGWRKIVERLGELLKRPSLGPLLKAKSKGGGRASLEWLDRFPSDPSAPTIRKLWAKGERERFDAEFAEAKESITAALKKRDRNTLGRLARLRHSFDAWLADPNSDVRPDAVALVNSIVASGEQEKRLRDELGSVQSELAAAQDDVTSAKAQLQLAQNISASRQADLRNATSDLASIREEHSTKLQELSAAQDELLTLRTKASSDKEAAASLQTALNESRDEVESTRKALSVAEGKLEANSSENASAKREVTEAKGKIVELETAADRSRHRVRDLEQRARGLALRKTLLPWSLAGAGAIAAALALILPIRIAESDVPVAMQALRTERDAAITKASASDVVAARATADADRAKRSELQASADRDAAVRREDSAAKREDAARKMADVARSEATQAKDGERQALSAQSVAENETRKVRDDLARVNEKYLALSAGFRPSEGPTAVASFGGGVGPTKPAVSSPVPSSSKLVRDCTKGAGNRFDRDNVDRTGNDSLDKFSAAQLRELLSTCENATSAITDRKSKRQLLAQAGRAKAALAVKLKKDSQDADNAQTAMTGAKAYLEQASGMGSKYAQYLLGYLADGGFDRDATSEADRKGRSSKKQNFDQFFVKREPARAARLFQEASNGDDGVAMAMTSLAVLMQDDDSPIPYSFLKISELFDRAERLDYSKAYFSHAYAAMSDRSPFVGQQAKRKAAAEIASRAECVDRSAADDWFKDNAYAMKTVTRPVAHCEQASLQRR